MVLDGCFIKLLIDVNRATLPHVVSVRSRLKYVSDDFNTLQKLLKDNPTSFPAVNFTEEFDTEDISINPRASFCGKRYHSIV